MSSSKAGVLYMLEMIYAPSTIPQVLAVYYVTIVYQIRVAYFC